MTDPIRAALERLHQYAETFPEHDTDSIVAAARAALSAPKRVEGVGELALELELMANRAAHDSRFGDAHFLSRAATLLAQRHPAPVPVSERLQQMEDLAADAVSGLRYIEQSYGLLYGVGWDRVYEKADRLRPAHTPGGGGAVTLPADIARCSGWGDGPEGWLEECHDCKRRTAAGGEVFMEPPSIIAFFCEFVIPGDEL